jgi:hypothetical protein
VPNYRKTEELTLKLLKDQPKYPYYRSAPLEDEERFYRLTCRQTRNKEGHQIPLLDNQGNPIFYQLQYFLDSDTEVLNEDQKQMLLQNPRFKDPATGQIKKFPYKTLRGMIRVLTEEDGKEWLVTTWMYEGLKRDKGIESHSFKLGNYEHPIPETELKYLDPNDKDKGYTSVITAINHKTVYDTPFTKENIERVLAERSGPKDEKHVNMSLIKIGPSGSKNSFALSVTDKEQFISRPFTEIWDYLASAPARKTDETKIGREKDREKNKHYS